MKRLRANLSKDRNIKPISFNNPRKEDLLSLQEKRVQKDLTNLPKDPGAIGKLGKFLPNWEKFTSDWEKKDKEEICLGSFSTERGLC